MESYDLDLDPDQLRLYGGSINHAIITIRAATAAELSTLTPSTPDSVILYKSHIESGMHLPLTPLLAAVLSHFDIAPCQVSSRFYRIVSVASAAVPLLRHDLVLTPDLFLNCYKLSVPKKSDTGAFSVAYLSPRHSDVAAPGGTLPKTDKRDGWMDCPFVAVGRWSQGIRVRSVPNPEVEVKPPPVLSGQDAVAFRLLRRGRNPEFDEFLKTAHATGEQNWGIVTRLQASSKRRKLILSSSGRKVSINHREAKTTGGLHAKPSQTYPPKNTSQLSESLSGPRAASDTISAFPFKPDRNLVIQEKSTLECPATDTGAVGNCCRPRELELETVDVDGLFSTGTIFLSKAMTMFENGMKRFRETRKCASSAEGLMVENEQLKAELEGLKQQCSEIKLKIKSDASEVLGLEGLKEENEGLKVEMEVLKTQCLELKSKRESDASEIRRLEYQLLAERRKLERELMITRAEAASRATTIHYLPAQKDELSRLFEQFNNEMGAKDYIIRELQSSIEQLEGNVASSMEREAMLRVSVLLGGQSADAHAKQARQAGYNAGIMDGRKRWWSEFVELQKREPSEPLMPVQSCSSSQAGSSFHPHSDIVLS